MKLGERYDVPVIPVNHLEAHIMTSRFSQIGQPGDRRAPLLKFPYVSALVTGKHTEIILTEGVGNHTIMGKTDDIAVGNALDKLAVLVLERLEEIKEEGQLNRQIREFVSEYNADPERRSTMSSTYFDKMFRDVEGQRFHHGGRLIEVLAKYGDANRKQPQQVEFFVNRPQPGGRPFEETLDFSTSCDMQFAGFHSIAQRAFEQQPLSFRQILNLCSSM